MWAWQNFFTKRNKFPHMFALVMARFLTTLGYFFNADKVTLCSFALLMLFWKNMDGPKYIYVSFPQNKINYHVKAKIIFWFFSLTFAKTLSSSVLGKCLLLQAAIFLSKLTTWFNLFLTNKKRGDSGKNLEWNYDFG